ncbi:putative RNA methyltransferase At5g10620 isoform X7 [Andrographis paniculata]|uniref:putative RNA methyltransferase At5g10620 isoform X7 n=1 Tax=Andrographis paniculata TaxID=175694 RepID=UPI0021E7323F|nr:putative RNA methyltransferase At5g10620 isoform X7 [Andrographis paniculata]
MDHWSLGQTSPSMGAHLLASSSCRATYVPAPGKQCKHAGQSVRPLPIRILTVGKKRSAGVQLIVDEYIEKLKHYCPVVDVRVKSNPRNARDVRAQIDHEDMAVMDLIKSSEWVVMLDERGLDVGSEQIASIIADAGNSGALSITFCIGGPYGHGRQLRERANASIKLSSLVLNHEIALVVLAEQLYRAWTILKGQKYHHN